MFCPTTSFRRTCVVAAGAVVILLVVATRASGAVGECRSIDGVGNNQANPQWGSAERALIRKAPIAYADGISEPNGQDRPNPRLVTLTLCQQDAPMPSRRNTTDFLWAFGVFVNHDMDITESASPTVPFNIPVPRGDPYFDPAGTGTQEIIFGRGKTVEGTGTSTTNPLQLDNSDTAFLDLSTVYGSDDARAAWLRTNSGGRMKTSSHPTGDLLPFNDGTQFNLGNFEVADSSTNLFLAGDVRSNVSAFLATMHTLFVRNHNYWADQFAAEDASRTDEELYQLARRRNIAELQNIAIYQWLATLLGEGAVPDYPGYDPNVDPTVAVEFSTVILRSVGHTLLPTEIMRLNEDGTEIAQGHVLLRDSFFDNAPIVVQSAGIDPILRGLASKHCQESDSFFVDDIHHFLFTLPGAGGRDLTALNIQRARDFGIPDYNTLREAYGLPRNENFSDITSDPQRATELESLYGTTDDIDPFIGAVSEGHAGSGSVGELVRAGMLDQLLRIRDGDRFWFENPDQFSADEISEIRNTKLSDVIRRNTGVRNIQDDVFVMPSTTPTTRGPRSAVPAGLCGALSFQSLALMGVSLVALRRSSSPTRLG